MNKYINQNNYRYDYNGDYNDDYIDKSKYVDQISNACEKVA